MHWSYVFLALIHLYVAVAPLMQAEVQSLKYSLTTGRLLSQ